MHIAAFAISLIVIALFAFVGVNYVAPFLRAKASLRAKSHPGARKIAGRHMVADVSIAFRMNSGSAGDVNRSHPASIEPCLIDAAAPPTAYGQAVLGDVTSGGVRPLTTADAGTTIYGVTVRPYPTQQTTGGMAASFGAAVAAANGVTDVLKYGYVMVPVVGACKKFNPIYIWIAAPSGNHVTGGFEAVSGGANTALLARGTFNSAPDANGLAEVCL